LIVKINKYAFVAAVLLGLAPVGAISQDAASGRDREEAREYVGPSDESYMILQGRIVQLEARMDAAEEAIVALIAKLDANALEDQKLLDLLLGAGVLKRQR
jgi:hypothetical protein